MELAHTSGEGQIYKQLVHEIRMYCASLPWRKYKYDKSDFASGNIEISIRTQ